MVEVADAKLTSRVEVWVEREDRVKFPYEEGLGVCAEYEQSERFLLQRGKRGGQFLGRRRKGKGKERKEKKESAFNSLKNSLRSSLSPLSCTEQKLFRPLQLHPLLPGFSSILDLDSLDLDDEEGRRGKRSRNRDGSAMER